MGNRTVYPRQVYQDGERAEAEFISSQRQLEVGNRNSFTTEVELDTFTRNVAVTQARYKQSLANYEFITIQHSYSKITAPMSGAIASVSTQQGETVAASFAAPTFLTIVDLQRLEIQAYVDESDIGQINLGLEVSFTVDTYAGAIFSGKVQGIYPKAQIVNNVVNYIVIIGIERIAGYVLRPEMTAHIQFVIQKKQDTITIEDIITSILEGQRINLQTMELDLSRFDLSELVDEVVALNISREPGIAQTIHTGVIEVQADKHLLKLLLHNLLDNALKYSLPDTQAVQVLIAVEEGRVVLSIADDGTGVAEENLPKLYEPFYKVAKDRGFNSGYGLGLNLVKRIVDIHQWTISIKNRQPRGLEVSIQIDTLH